MFFWVGGQELGQGGEEAGPQAFIVRFSNPALEGFDPGDGVGVELRWEGGFFSGAKRRSS